ncbi:ribosome small subunit-dependent GTPase A [Staphylococcus chromogenes]|uniref:ribosome small subunit-dependent GTPase A n=1 Tax=Staphylococcus chromogenes TaxID=46126 RepID=UPI000D1B2010|nr:ribosome small subunit-dependent GTPase A [Staphylococcus chromogenes]MCE4965588.1 ribosome small subunit-dependent GTPase A [Staphylococcus chromogenes]MDT0692148.1 ribosome small subunit-dependent GTPase A [Staphylococcus chromogenes]MDT0699723.1 ribosome small subunit-dependent GTPase A [Staphylococcus chromogenes]PTF67963.1 ribosome small subunit-dependent GTPase A [Staphylococcus chromogenes]PTF75675.1 ribosome small subunit-dependent GTPase A [Staphylococcus chromogenes]
MKTGRIIRSLSGVYRVDVDGTLYDAKPRGLFRKKQISPIVGDIVDIDDETHASGYIHHIHPRKNELKRPPVSNIDLLVIVMSAVSPNFSTQLLDRFLVIGHSYGLKPRIVITKKDLATKEEINEIENILSIYEDIGYATQFVGKDDAASEIFTEWEPGLAVLSGQSGVGKSSLLNKFQPTFNIETNEISTSLNRGKHTTRHVELYPRAEGFIADTPGFSALDFDHIDKETLRDNFIEISRYGEQCKFRDCYHVNEPKCHVKASVEAGEISEFRYQHYVQLLNEISNRKVKY